MEKIEDIMEYKNCKVISTGRLNLIIEKYFSVILGFEKLLVKSDSFYNLETGVF